MDLLYRRYADPSGIIRYYSDSGMIYEFVRSLILQDRKEKREEQEQEDDRRLFQLWMNSGTDKNFSDWKESVLHPESQSISMSAEQAERQVEQSRGILKRLSV